MSESATAPTEDNSKKDGVQWLKQLQKEKHDADVATVEKALQKDPKDRSGEEFWAMHRLKVEEHEKAFIKKSRLAQKSESSK